MLTVKAEVDLSEPKCAYATAKSIFPNTGDMEWSPHNLAHVNAVPEFRRVLRATQGHARGPSATELYLVRVRLHRLRPSTAAPIDE